MLYISGENEKLQDLKEREGFEGTLSDYMQKLRALNPHLKLDTASSSQILPSYIPVYLVLEPSSIASYEKEQVVHELNRYSIEERKTLREMQVHEYDIISQVTLADIMEDLQHYSAKFREKLDDPLITTPWTAFNRSFTTTSLVDIFSEASILGAESIEKWKLTTGLEQLYENMLARDSLNTRLHLLQGEKGAKAIKLRQNLAKQIADLDRQIKLQLPRKIDSTMTKYLHTRFTPEEARRLRVTSYSKKMARKGRLATTQLDILNKTGLTRLRKVISQLKSLGGYLDKSSKYLGIGVVAYDTIKAYRDNGKVARTLFSGAVGIAAGTMLVNAAGGTTALGGMVIGTLGGTALSTTALVCIPGVGWVVIIAVVAVGVVTTSYVSNRITEAAESLWDGYGEPVVKQVSNYAHMIYDSLKSAWSSGSHWILDHYGSKG